MAQFSMEIICLTGSVLRGNQHQKLKEASLMLAGLFTVWLSNSQVEALYDKLQVARSKLDPYGVDGRCVGFDTTLLFFTCILAGIAIGVLVHYFVVKEHKRI